MLAVCAITDGYERVDLMSKGSGYHLRQWLPALSEPTGGGVWQQSPLANGRRLVMRPMDNITDGFVLALDDADMNAAIFEMRRLRGLLEEAVAYWNNDNANRCVWIEARGGNESRIRYALIYDYRTPSDPDPFNVPFYGTPKVMVDQFPLILEHDFWQDVPPTMDTCLEISSKQAHIAKVSWTSTKQVIDNYDDIMYKQGSEIIDRTSVTVAIDKDSVFGGSSAGLRFTNIDVPPGATILTAKIQLYAYANGFVGVNLVISGQKSANPKTFSTSYDELKARPRTRTVIQWDNVPVWLDDTWNDSVDISHIIQELVNQEEWLTGNSMAFFIEDNPREPSVIPSGRRFRSFDFDPDLAPVLVITYAVGLDILGSDKTCSSEVYVVNKHVKAQLTHIFASSLVPGGFSANLYAGNVFPLNLYPLPPGLTNPGDYIYFGSDVATSTLGPYGGYAPFDSLVFDNEISHMSQGTWQYWNGAAWTNLDVNDNSHFVGATWSWSITGVFSVHWTPPSNWATVAVNGVTGWWVRFVFSALAVDPPIQYNRHVYAINRPCVDVLEEDVGGDIPLRLRLQIINVSNYNSTLYMPNLWANRVMVASRSLSRGELFTPYINLADRQNDPNITVTVADIGSFADYVQAPSGRVVTFAPGALAASAIQAVVTLDAVISVEYYGKYRVFVRGKQVGGVDGDVGVKVTVQFGGINLFASDEVFTKRAGYPELIELGQVTIINIIGENYADDIIVNVYCSSGVAATFHLFDLILFPVDEYVGDFIDTNTTSSPGDIGARADYRSMLEINSTTEHKRPVSANVKLSSPYSLVPISNYLYSRYTPIQIGQTFLQKGCDQRIWFLAERIRDTPSEWVSEPDIAFMVKAYVVNRYHSMRGET